MTAFVASEFQTDSIAGRMILKPTTPTNQKRASRTNVSLSQLLRFACCFAIAAFYVGGEPSHAQEKQAIAIETIHPVAVTSIQKEWSFSGTIQAKRRSSLGFDRVGRLQTVHVQLGDIVEKDEVLAELNSESIAAGVKKLRAEKVAAEATLSEYRSGERKETLETARAQLREQRAAMDNAKLAFDRRTALRADRLISKEELDNASASYKGAVAAHDAASHRLAELEAGTRVERIRSQEAKVDALAASLEAAIVDLEHSKLRSPYNGMIVKRSSDEGTVVSPNQPVLTILETSNLEAHFGVPVEAASSLKAGQSAAIRVREKVVSGKIKSVVREISEQSRTQQLVVRLDDKSAKSVVVGENARLLISNTQPASGFLVSSAALLRGPRGLWECYVVTNIDANGVGTLKKMTVEVVDFEQDNVLIRGSLSTKDHLVASSTHRVTTGQRVRIAKTEAIK